MSNYCSELLIEARRDGTKLLILLLTVENTTLKLFWWSHKSMGKQQISLKVLGKFSCLHSMSMKRETKEFNCQKR